MVGRLSRVAGLGVALCGKPFVALEVSTGSGSDRVSINVGTRWQACDPVATAPGT